MPAKETRLIFANAMTIGEDGSSIFHDLDKLWVGFESTLELSNQEERDSEILLACQVSLNPACQGAVVEIHGGSRQEPNVSLSIMIPEEGEYQLELVHEGRVVRHNLSSFHATIPAVVLDNTEFEFEEMYDCEEYAYNVKEDSQPLVGFPCNIRLIFRTEVEEEVCHVGLSPDKVKVVDDEGKEVPEASYDAANEILSFTPQYPGEHFVYIDGALVDQTVMVTGLIAFDEDSVQMARTNDNHFTVFCEHSETYTVTWDMIKGNDGANKEDIARVTGVNLRKQDFSSDDARVELAFRAASASKAERVKKMIKLLMKGKHYREEATYHEQRRQHFRDAAERSYKSRDFVGNTPSVLKRVKSIHAILMEEAHELAKSAYFEFHNNDRPLCEIDLHDLRAYKDSTEGVPGEAIEVLRKRMKNKKLLEKFDWLEIIVGAGHHSEADEQRLRPLVEWFLENQGKDYPIYREAHCEYQVINKGSLLITFKAYSGPIPCFGEFYCQDCDNVWKSRLSWPGYWQKCFKCKQETFLPVKLCATPPPRPTRGRRDGRRPPPHGEEMCEKCQEFGTLCANYA